MAISFSAGYDPTQPISWEDRATQGFKPRSKKLISLDSPFSSQGADESYVGKERSWEGGERGIEQDSWDPSTRESTSSSGSGFFSPDGAINFARNYAADNAPPELSDEVSKVASTFETPFRRDEPTTSETSNTIDRAVSVSGDPTRGVSRTVETGKIEREERPVYTSNRATQGISSRPTQDTAPRPTVPSGRATQGIGGSATPTGARATQGIGSRVGNFFNTLRDTVTPSSGEYIGNILKSAFQGGEQVNRTDFKDSDVVSLFERTDAGQVPRTTGAKTRFSDTKVYENAEGVLVPHTEETLKQFPPNARGLVYDYQHSSNPFIDNYKKATYGYQNPLGVRGEGYVEINQPNEFESPTAVYKDAAYLNLRSTDPNETTFEQGIGGKVVAALTGNKSDILGTEYARAELPYSQWSKQMRADYGFPNFQDSLEATANNETSFSNNYLDQYVDKMGNVKEGVTRDRSGQATGFETGAPETYWEGGRQFEIQPEVYNPQGELQAPEGRTEITDPWSMENLESRGFLDDGTLVASGWDSSNVDEWSRRLLQGGFPTEKDRNEKLKDDPYGGYGKGRGMGDRGDASLDGDTLVASNQTYIPMPKPTNELEAKYYNEAKQFQAKYGDAQRESIDLMGRSPDHPMFAGVWDKEAQPTTGTAEQDFLGNYIKDPEEKSGTPADHFLPSDPNSAYKTWDDYHAQVPLTDDYIKGAEGDNNNSDQRWEDYNKAVIEEHKKMAQTRIAAGLDPGWSPGDEIYVNPEQARKDWEADGGPAWGEAFEKGQHGLQNKIYDGYSAEDFKNDKPTQSTDLPSWDQLQSGEGYIKNVDTGEVTKIGGSKPGGVNTSSTTNLNKQEEAEISSSSSWDPGSDPAVAASDKAVAEAEAAWKTASTNQQNYLGGRTAGTQEEFNEYMKLQALSDAASKRLDAAYAQQAEAMKNYSSN